MSQRTRHIETCNLCGSHDLEKLTPPDADGSYLLMCRACTLFMASPTIPLSGMDHFYDEDFIGDAGSKAGAAGGKKNDTAKNLMFAQKWAVPIVAKFAGSLKGKKVLDLRSRDGAIAKALATAGADVTATDPMMPNVEQSRANGVHCEYVSINSHATLESFPRSAFDLITGLTIHVLSHLPDPAAFLHAAFERLKPGGLLVLDEKDVLKPHRVQTASLFGAVGAHLFQFTRETMRCAAERAGFEIVSCDYDDSRASKYRHMILVARRPASGNPAQAPFTPFPNAVDVRKKISEAERFLWLTSPYHRTLKRVKRLFR